MKLTTEQFKIIKSKESEIFVKARAGTGKTTTLIEYAKENFNFKILYLVFNKDLRKTSIGRFPINCTIHTINSFAYSFYNKPIKDSYNVIDIINVLNIDEDEAYSLLLDIQIYLRTNTIRNDLVLKFCKEVFNKNYIWDQDFLLKFVDIDVQDYDIVMVDEAQDINPVTLDIIYKLNPKKKIFVGDDLQAIYGFRDNINIFEDKTHFYELTQTFRFGDEIADVINNKFKTNIKGSSNINSKIITESIIGNGSVYISRTNSHLFDKAIEYALLDYKISIPFNMETISSLIESIYYLKLGINNEIKNSEIKHFKTYENFKRKLKLGQNLEFKYLFNLIEKYDICILEYLKLIERKLSSPKHADIVFLTAHKAKGLEFPFVEIGSDFKETSQEERNLLYVAYSRAILELKI